MKKVGIVICNYNKSNYVVNCIQSVIESKYTDFDIFMVDNASTDDSIEAVQNRFGDRVTILANSENLGGSGGFNTGIRKVLESDYEYIYCLDNDVLVDENAVGALANYLDQHPETGVCGSIVYHMDHPEYVQQYGLDLDFEHCSAITHFADYLDDGNIPDVNECDTVATCSVMVRTKCIKESNIGIMPEGNFIYWDDMEWIYRFNLSGNKIVTIKDSVVLHKMGANVRPQNTFIQYYMWRNRTSFFMRYTPENEIDAMSYRVLSSFFDMLYLEMFREEHNVAQTISYAYQDAITGVKGKAAEHKILENDENDDKIINYLVSKKTFYLEAHENNFIYEEVLEKIMSWNPNLTQVESPEMADVCIKPCDYVMNLNESTTSICIDIDGNCVLDVADWEVVKNYAYSKSLYIYLNQPIFLDAVYKLRKEENNNG